MFIILTVSAVLGHSNSRLENLSGALHGPGLKSAIDNGYLKSYYYPSSEGIERELQGIA
jgi:hypothetical protein